MDKLKRRVADRVDVELHSLIDREIESAIQLGIEQGIAEPDDLRGSYRVLRMRQMSAWRTRAIDEISRDLARRAEVPHHGSVATH